MMELRSVNEKRAITVGDKSRKPKMVENACSWSKMRVVG